MKTRRLVAHLGCFFFLSGLIFLGACQKNPGHSVKRLSDEDSLKFYVWWYTVSDSQTIPTYYWYDQVPKLDPLSRKFANADSLLSGQQGIASYPEVAGRKVDRYSFLDRAGAVSEELQGGQSGDFGLEISPALDQDNQVVIVVLFTYKGSPAGNAHIHRGWIIKALDGNTDMTWDGGDNSQRIINAIYGKAQTKFTFSRLGASDTTVTLNRASYHINPILLDTVYTVGAKKVGYFVYNSFISISGSSNSATAKSEIDAVFAHFKEEGVQELIVDLRYNGGGTVVSAEYLDDLIAPASANGQEMYSIKYNDQLTAYFAQDPTLKAEFLAPINFELPPNNLNLSRVFFIVGANTASASELTINNLKPYMDVKLVGTQTYGKPVGFFPAEIAFVTDTAGYTTVADLYAINDETVNSQGKGGYYQGMTPDYTETDYIGYDWGDTSAPRLSAILSYIAGNGFTGRKAYSRLVPPAFGQLRMSPATRIPNPRAITDMIDYRKSLPHRR
jgi:C-terminal processing protease CtpA/Prc